MEEVAELQALGMHGRVAKTDALKPSVAVLSQHLDKLQEPDAVVADAHSEEAMRAQAAAERMLGGPANG